MLTLMSAPEDSAVRIDAGSLDGSPEQFVEVLMAPGYTTEALEVFKTKVNVRILQIDLPTNTGPGKSAWDNGRTLMLVSPPDQFEVLADA